MKIIFLQILMLFVFIILNNCMTIKNSDFINKNGNQDITNKSSRTFKIDDDKWQSAIFERLKVGKSLRSDALKILGKPSSSNVFDYNDSPISSDREDTKIIDKYENFGFYGELNIIYSKKSKIISEIISYPESLKVEEAIKHFGENYKRTQYDFVECPGDAGSSRIYESENGVLKYIEYRSKGIAIKIDDSEKQVEEISFVSQPIGLSLPDCSEKSGK